MLQVPVRVYLITHAAPQGKASDRPMKACGEIQGSSICHEITGNLTIVVFLYLILVFLFVISKTVLSNFLLEFYVNSTTNMLDIIIHNSRSGQFDL